MEAAIEALKTALYVALTNLATYIQNPKPSYTIEGQSVQWGEYLKMILDGIKTTIEVLNMFDVVEMRMVAG
jgi:hypothetical protein